MKITEKQTIIAKYLIDEIIDQLDEVVMVQRNMPDMIDAKKLTYEVLKSNFTLQADMVSQAMTTLYKLEKLIESNE